MSLEKEDEEENAYGVGINLIKRNASIWSNMGGDGKATMNGRTDYGMHEWVDERLVEEKTSIITGAIAENLPE